MQGGQFKKILWNVISILGGFWKLVWVHYSERGFQMNLWSMSLKYRREKILDEETAWSSHCPFMLETHLFLPFQEIFVLSHPGNEDSCYGKHTMELALWAQSQLILWQLCVFTRKIAIFKETIPTDRGRGREKHVKHAHSNFNQQGRPWGWLTKWRKKTASLLKRNVSLQSPRHDRRKTGEAVAGLYGAHALYQLNTTHVWAGESAQAFKPVLHFLLHRIYSTITLKPKHITCTLIHTRIHT